MRITGEKQMAGSLLLFAPYFPFASFALSTFVFALPTFLFAWPIAAFVLAAFAPLDDAPVL